MSDTCGLCFHGNMAHWVQYAGPPSNPTKVEFVCKCGCREYVGIEELFKLLKRVLRGRGLNVRALIDEALGKTTRRAADEERRVTIVPRNERGFILE